MARYCDEGEGLAQIERPHVGPDPAEVVHSLALLSRHFEHLWRCVQSDNGEPVLCQARGDAAGAAGDFEYGSPAALCSGCQFSIEGEFAGPIWDGDIVDLGRELCVPLVRQEAFRSRTPFLCVRTSAQSTACVNTHGLQSPTFHAPTGVAARGAPGRPHRPVAGSDREWPRIDVVVLDACVRASARGGVVEDGACRRKAIACNQVKKA